MESVIQVPLLRMRSRSSTYGLGYLVMGRRVRKRDLVDGGHVRDEDWTYTPEATAMWVRGGARAWCEQRRRGHLYTGDGWRVLYAPRL